MTNIHARKTSIVVSSLAICALTACSQPSATAAKTTPKTTAKSTAKSAANSPANSTKAKATKAKAPNVKPAITEKPMAPPSAWTSSDLVDVPFDTPGKDPRPINEVTVDITKPVSLLRMNITKLTYRGVVCGFSFRGEAPKSPVTIVMSGGNKSRRFDSGKVPVSWIDVTSTDTMTAGSSSSNGWNFSAEAHPNRTGPGWVVSLGGVTAAGPDAIPTDVTCELHAETPIDPKSGPVGYWAGFATV